MGDENNLSFDFIRSIYFCSVFHVWAWGFSRIIRSLCSSTVMNIHTFLCLSAGLNIETGFGLAWDIFFRTNDPVDCKC